MRKKLLAGTGIAAVLGLGVLLGSLTLGSAFAQSPSTHTPTQATVQGSDDDATEAAVKGPDIDNVDERVGEQNQVDEAAALQSKATISATDAEAAALAANPDASVVKTELDNENGVLVYSVELSNGNDVKVDAGNRQILHTEAAGIDSEGQLEGQETAED